MAVSLVAAVLTMSAAQLFDLGTFVEMVRRVGPESEANPLVGILLGAYGVPMVATAKVALIALVSAVVAVIVQRPAHLTLVRVVLGLGILVGLVGGISNTRVFLVL